MSAVQPQSTENRFKNIDVGIVREGTKITLPNDPVPMNYDEAINALQRKKEEENTTVAVNEVVKAFPFDGAYAFMKAMKQIYGWANPVPTPGFFGPTPPRTVSVEIDFGQTTQIIWGDFKIPGISGKLSTGVWREGKMVYFCIQGEVKKLHMPDVKKLADLTRHLASTESIYRGKAIKLETNSEGAIDFNLPPKFLDLSGVNEEELTYSEDTAAQVKTFLWTPVEQTQACRKLRIPLKRGVLLEGPYGTGKTLTAFATAKKATRNGWTFVLLDKVGGLKDALNFSRLYQPCVLFAEDIDRAVTGERTVQMDDILNTIDGGESKGSEVITILTSNHVEDINKAMIRPGRLDAVIRIGAPDALAVQKLVRIYSRDTLNDSEDLSEVGTILAGQIPAVIREAVERAKLYAVARDPGAETIKITGKDLSYAAKGMGYHLGLLHNKAAEPTKEQVFYNAFRSMVQESVGSTDEIEFIETKVEEIYDTVN